MKIRVLNIGKVLEYIDKKWLTPVFKDFGETGELASEGGVGTAIHLEVDYYEVTLEGLKHLSEMNSWSQVLKN